MKIPELLETKKHTHPAVIMLATAFICIPILAVGQFIAHFRIDETDPWLFAYYGRYLLEGKILYRALWDNKPPGIFWLNGVGLWLGGGSIWGVRVLCGLAVCGATGLIFITARRLYGLWTAVPGTILAALFLTIAPYHVGANRPSTFAVLSALACFYFYCRSFTARWSVGWLMAAGLMGGLGPCLKQNFLAISGAVVIHHFYLVFSRQMSIGRVIGRGFCFAVGFAVAVGGAIGALALTSDSGWAWNAIVDFNRHYFAPGLGGSLWPRFFGTSEHVKVMGLPLILGLSTIFYRVITRFVSGFESQEEELRAQEAKRGQPPGLLFFLWIWFLLALYCALLGPHKRMHYFGIVLPPVVMLCGQSLYYFLRSGLARKDAFFLVVGFVWLGFMLVWPIKYQVKEALIQFYYLENPSDTKLVEMADEIRRHSGPSESMFVFGYEPRLYWEANRPPAIRYIGTEKAGQLRQLGKPLKREILRLLYESEPKILAAASDQTDDGRWNEWLRENYRQDEEYRGLWVRRDK